jgi:hypothetical protein
MDDETSLKWNASSIWLGQQRKVIPSTASTVPSKAINMRNARMRGESDGGMVRRLTGFVARGHDGKKRCFAGIFSKEPAARLPYRAR